MKKTDIQFGGVTFDEFSAAVQTCATYLNAAATTPITDDNEPHFVVSGVPGLLLNMAQSNFYKKLEKLKDRAEKRVADKAAIQENPGPSPEEIAKAFPKREKSIVS